MVWCKTNYRNSCFLNMLAPLLNYSKLCMLSSGWYSSFRLVSAGQNPMHICTHITAIGKGSISKDSSTGWCQLRVHVLWGAECT